MHLNHLYLQNILLYSNKEASNKLLQKVQIGKIHWRAKAFSLKQEISSKTELVRKSKATYDNRTEMEIVNSTVDIPEIKDEISNCENSTKHENIPIIYKLLLIGISILLVIFIIILIYLCCRLKKKNCCVTNALHDIQITKRDLKEEDLSLRLHGKNIPKGGCKN